MFIALAATTLALAGAPNIAPSDSASVRTRVDSARREIVFTVSAIDIPAIGGHGAEIRVPVEWPVTGWMRGFRVDVLDASGNLLPRDMLHHAGVVNLDRRQLAYPVPERLIAAGSETVPVLLPASMGVPMTPDQHLVLFYMLSNHTPNAVNGAQLRVTINWTPSTENKTRNVMPFIVDALVAEGGGRSFDVPRGVSVTSSEFTIPVNGKLRALGGHLHDYATEIRLEDAATNKVLARLKTTRDAVGRVTSVGSTKFLLTWGGLRLTAGHTYRIVSVYDNPTCALIPQGAMAALVGVFIPDDMKSWPAVNRADPLYAEDFAQLMGNGESMNMDDMDGMDMGHGAQPVAPCRGPKG